MMTTILTVVVMLVAGFVYYKWKYKSLGGTEGYLKKQLGLREGEKTTMMWMCYFDIDRTTGEKVDEVLFNVHTRGINVIAALTDAGRLAIGDNETKNPPMGFELGQVAISQYPKKSEMPKLAGMNGMETAVVMLVQPKNAEPFRLQIAQSGFDAIHAWAASA